jgi:hypothetical protein
MTTELLEKVLESVGGEKEFERKRVEFKRDLAFIEENKEELLGKYINRWVAVYNSEVVAHSKHYGDVISQLERANKPVDQIPIRYISKYDVFALYLWL